MWLKGSGSSGDAKQVRRGHLMYLPHLNEYSIVVMDDRSRLAITVLTEEMALTSSWRQGLDEASKLKAKRIALGKEAVDGSCFLRLYAEERGELSVNVCVKTVSYDWQPVVFVIYKTNIKAEQVDINKKHFTLMDDQIAITSKLIKERIAAKEIRPYGDFYVITNNGKTALISNCINGVFSLDDAESARRWAV